MDPGAVGQNAVSPVLRANGYFFNAFTRYMLQDVQKANDAISTQNGTSVC
jgi:hypothetical protein